MQKKLTERDNSRLPVLSLHVMMETSKSRLVSSTHQITGEKLVLKSRPWKRMVITHISSISKKAMSLFPISNVSLHANIAIRQRRARNQSSIKVTVLSAGKLTLLSISKPISLGKKMVPENLHALELVLKALPPTVTINFTSAPIATKVVKPAKIMASSVILRSAENALTSIQCFTLLIKNA